jgi:predicted RNA-binding protein with PUA-like domain
MGRFVVSGYLSKHNPLEPVLAQGLSLSVLPVSESHWHSISQVPRQCYSSI